MSEPSSQSILVIDDSPLNLEFLVSALRRAGFDVFMAKNGEEGLQKAAERKPSLILLDIMMPGLNGYETCKLLKQDPDLQMVPVIFMTALSDIADKVKGFQVGAADYVTKPTEIPEVIARVKTHLKISELQQSMERQNEELREQNERRLRVQDALRHSRQQYRLLAEHATDIIARQSLDGIFVYVSPACKTILGYEVEELIGRSILDVVHPDDLARVKAEHILPEKCPEASTVTFRANRKDGGYTWLEIVSKTICDPATGHPDEIVSVAREVTERVELTAQLQQKNDELDAFSHMVAHDLKNPLGTIITYTDFLLDAWDKLNDAKKFELIKNIRGVGQQGISIIKELLLLASIRKESIDTETLDMFEIVYNVRYRLQLMIEEFEGELIAPQVWPEAVGYGPWVEEVWANYVSNGLKYGGHPPLLELGADPAANGMVRFWIKDNGDGLTPEEQSRLFAEFSRLDDIGVVEGNGLGLSIVRRIVNKLGGQVGVESQPGQGSTFFFSLPAAPAAE
jgi:PAS domain S-box-containing protein